MQSELVEQILNLEEGNHLCLFYDRDPAEQMDALVPFIQDGLARNEQFIYVADDQTCDELANQLERSGVNLASESDRGALKLWTRREWRQPGELCSAKKSRQVRQLMDDSKQAGFEGIRFAVEMTWTLGPDISPSLLEHWEATINTIFVPGVPGRIICQYNRSRLPAEALLAALHTHPLAILGDEVCPNLFYQAPLILNGNGHQCSSGNGEAGGNGNGKSGTLIQVEWMIGQLKRARAAEKQRQELLLERAAHAEAARAKRKIQSVLESISDGFVALEPDWRFAYVNAAAERLLGRSAADLLGRDYWQEFPGSAGTETERQFRRAVTEHTTVEFEVYNPPLRRWFAMKAYPAVTGGLSVYLRDVTESKRTEDALRTIKGELETQVDDLRQLHRISSRLWTTFELQPVLREVLHAALAVHDTDMGLLSLCDPRQEGLRVGVSSGFNSTFLEAIDFIPSGAGACGVCYQQRERVIVEDVERDPMFAPYRECARLGGFRAVHSTPLITREGNIIGVLSVHFRQPYRPSERQTRLIDLFARQAADHIESARLREQAERDLAERRRAEEALRHGEELQRRLLSLMPVGVYACDADGRITFYNRRAAELWGRQPLLNDELEKYCGGHKVYLQDGTYAPPAATPMAIALREGKQYRDLEAAFERPDGSQFVASVSIDPIRDKDGQVCGAINAFQDITDRKRAEEAVREAKEQLARANEELERRVQERTAELKETNSQLEAFVYSIAHDLRAPLRSMEAFSTLLLEEYASRLDETARNYAGRVVRAAGRMDALVLDLLAYGRTARGEMALTAVSVDTAWAAAIAQHEQTIREKSAQVTATLPLPAVRAHEATLGQVLANLLGNALKFVAHGVVPCVHLRAEERENCVRLWIEDNGIGIAPEYHERIFRVFERLNVRDYSGTGIGLSIVRKGIERMGGRVGLESVPGQGSQFWIDLNKA